MICLRKYTTRFLQCETNTELVYHGDYLLLLASTVYAYLAYEV